MANPPIIIPGLAIPDPNFIWDIGDSWEVLTGMNAGDYVQRGSHMADDHMPTTGKVLEVATVRAAGGLDDGLRSSPSPFNIMCGAFVGQLYFWVGCIVKTEGVAAGNSNDLVQFEMEQYDADGTKNDTDTFTFTTEPGPLREPVADFTLYHFTRSLVLNATTRFFKLLVYFDIDSNGGAADTITLPWVGAGYADNGNPFLQTSWYTAEVSTSSNTLRRNNSPRGKMNPHIFVQDQGAQGQTVNVTFPLLTEADKARIMRAWMWNDGTPTAGIDPDIGSILDRGTSQPVIVALDRENIKKAFYADFAAKPMFTNSTPGWLPDSDTRWSTSLTFTERLF